MRCGRVRLLLVCAAGAACGAVYLLGALDYLREQSFERDFDDYPLSADVGALVAQARAGLPPRLAPVNRYDYALERPPSHKCAGARPRLLILVKSALAHESRRAAVRRTWGAERARVRTVFLLGEPASPAPALRARLDRESARYRDLLRARFVDTYFNNTIKTMVGFRWAYESCPSDFYLFADDDMFVSVTNLLAFLDDPSHYPRGEGASGRRSEESRLLAGFVFDSRPQRHRTSKWRVSLAQYRWDRWPPYVTGGAVTVARSALVDLYLASFFTQHFFLDDVYVGILAYKLRLAPRHSPHFYFYKKPYSTADYEHLIASHGYGDPHELQSVWSLQAARGRA